MALRALVDRLRAILAQVGAAEQSVGQGLDSIARSYVTSAAATHGSKAREPDQVAAHLAKAQRQAKEAQTALARAAEHISNYLEILGCTTQPTPEPPKPPPGKIEALRNELPPPFTSGSGRKTHGRWMGPDGVAHAIVSGYDNDSTDVREALRQLGGKYNRRPAVVAHVEAKLVARMVREKIHHVTVVLNNAPCPGEYGCERVLPLLLPKGYSLTVHAPGYLKTFVGGASQE